MKRPGGPGRSEEFERFYAARYPEITGYVQRRVTRTDVDDIVAQVFLVAWRRFHEIPDPPADRLWLFVVARNVLADHARSRRRQDRLEFRLEAEAATTRVSHDGDPMPDSVWAALSALRPQDREALQLVLWDDLSHADAAAVAGCSANAFEIRYRRARTAVRDALATGGPSSVSPIPVRENAR